MSDEIAVAAVILSLGAVISGLILNGQRALRLDLTGQRGEIAGLRSDLVEVRNELAQQREFMAPLKGLREVIASRRVAG